MIAHVLKSFKKTLGGLSRDPVLWAILGCALVVRLVCIGYGLPLWVVSDEPPFILGALQMIQLKTLLPVLHPAAFNTLYYPPYLSYLYLIPFVFVLGAEYVLWSWPHALFAQHVLSDLTPFFVVARCISIVFGLASIYLLYRIAESLFASKTAARVAAFLLATSITSIGLTTVARHWAPTTFVALLVMYILTRTRGKENQRYFYAVLAIGVGVGIDTTALMAGLIVLWWYFLYGRMSIVSMCKDKLILLGGFLFIALTILPTALHPGGNGFLANVSASNPKHLIGLIESPWHVFAFNLFSEPVLLGLCAIGLVLLFAVQRRLSVFVALWFLSYVSVFYMVFRLEPRFFLPLIPLYALVGAYAFIRVQSLHKYAYILLYILLAIPLASALRFSWLVFHSDTRTLARNYIESTLTPKDSIIVMADLTRLPLTIQAVAELRTIDPGAVRKVDEADEALHYTNVPYALDLYTVHNEAFIADIAHYARTYNIGYVLYQPSFAATTKEHEEAFVPLIATASTTATWHGNLEGPFESEFSMADSAFTAPFTELFLNDTLGPTVTLYRLH